MNRVNCKTIPSDLQLFLEESKKLPLIVTGEDSFSFLNC